jgi:hypothetical protein
VFRAWEVAVRWGLRIEDNVRHLPAPPLVLKEGEELPRSATGVEMGEPDSNKRAVPAPLVRVEVGGGASPISHIVLAQNLSCSRDESDLRA